MQYHTIQQRKMTEQSTSSLILELQQAMSDTTNQVNGRQTCTRILNQWKKEILPNLSNDECLQLLLCVGDDITDTICNDDNNDSCSSIPPTVQTLLSLINNDDEFSTEGHRESSVDILKFLFQQGFGSGSTDNQEVGNCLPEQQEDRALLQSTLTNLFYQCSQSFQKRMSKVQLVSSTNESSKFQNAAVTTISDPVESSEHIRLLLVELMLDLGGYCLASISTNTATHNNNIDLIESNNKKILNASSNLCQTLSKSINDPYPEVQRAACNLVEVLSKLCPLAVRMNAISLLVPLTGRVDDSCGTRNQLSTDTSIISKKCLFRHRHAKTRCKGVDASAAIVTCCPRGNSSPSSDDSQTSTTVPDHFSSYGSHSTTMEQILNDTLLPGWEELLKMDSSSSVQIAVLKALGNVASKLGWRYTPTTDNDQTLKESTMDLTSIVEAHILTLVFMCISSGNVDQVRNLAVQQLTSVRNSSDGSEHMPSWDILGAYFQPMMERVLASCSTSWTSCQSRVRSLGALQVILSIAIPLMDKSEPSFDMMNSIIDTLSENILSEEKEVLEAALTCCRILGANNHGSIVALEVVSSVNSCSEESSSLVVADSDSSEDSTTIAQSSPRQMTSILLMLDSMMKGSLCTEDSASILIEIDSTLEISTPNWFYTSTKSATTISSLLCHTTIINNVATNSSLAWALLDACKSFVQCTEHLGDKLELTESSIMNVLISITYLLSCPDQYGLASTAINILDVFSFTVLGQNDDDEGLTLLDVHFRTILPKIAAHEFPWKQSDPSFLAMDALLRHCKGSTVGNNFGLVAPFFISHLSNIPKKNEDNNGTQVLTMEDSTTTKDDLAEEYSLRISLMALLQTILSDQSFSQTDRGSQLQQKDEYSAVSSALAAQFTTDALLSIVIPNLVWKAGAMASVLRKIAVATLYSLLRHHCNTNQDGCTGMLRTEMISHLIPVLSSNVEDSESTTRELSCVCLSMVLEQVSDEIFSQICKTNKRVFDTLCPRLLESLDDSHNPVRVAACSALEAFIKLASNSQSSFDLELATLENILSSLLIQLDDPDKGIKESVFNTFSVLVSLYSGGANGNKEVVIMMKRLISTSLESHRDKTYCFTLLRIVEESGSS